MAQLPPGDIRTVPSQKLFFNAPFDNKISLYMKVRFLERPVGFKSNIPFFLQVVNAGGHRIGFAFKTTNAARLQMDPPSGVLDPKEEINILISCDAFDAEAQGTNSDRVTVEWVNTPEGAAKTFRREWLQGDVMTRRKNLPIEYNL